MRAYFLGVPRGEHARDKGMITALRSFVVAVVVRFCERFVMYPPTLGTPATAGLPRVGSVE